MNKNNYKILVNEKAYGKNKSSLNYWKDNRNKIEELYLSEKYFLVPALKCSKTVLDVGCAAGGSFDFCREANPDIDYIGIDISEELIDIAKHLRPTGSFFVYDGHKINLKKREIDLVFSIGVLHHLHHWKKMIIQMVNFSSKFTIFDLRLTIKDTLDNINKFYQKVTFNDKWDGKSAISYIVVNVNEFVDFIKNSFNNKKYRVESYGYYAKPTDLTNIPYDKVYMCCIKIEKNSLSPGIFIDIRD